MKDSLGNFTARQFPPQILIYPNVKKIFFSCPEHVLFKISITLLHYNNENWKGKSI